MTIKKNPVSIERFSNAVVKITGSTGAIFVAFILVIAWVIGGLCFGFTDRWLLGIGTGTSIITFLMVFVIQQAQNKDTLALQLKLNELIAATEGASNRALNIEDLTAEELKLLKKFYDKVSAVSEKEGHVGTAHSLDEKGLTPALSEGKGEAE